NVAHMLDGITGLVQHELLPRNELMNWIEEGDRTEDANPLPDRGQVFRRTASLHLITRAQAVAGEERASILRQARKVLQPAFSSKDPDRQTDLIAAILNRIESEGSSDSLGALIDLTAGPNDEINAFVMLQQAKQ